METGKSNLREEVGVIVSIGLFVGVILMSLIILDGIGYAIANHVKPLQKIYCKRGWHCHMKDYETTGFDGASLHCRCKWCGYEGLVDSQGNLF